MLSFFQNNRGIIRFFLRLIASVVCFVALWFFSNLGAAAKVALRADPYWITLAIALSLFRTPILAWRWKIIFGDLGISLGLGKLTRISFISIFFGIVLPSSNGMDLIRGMILKSDRIPLHAVVASIFVDRLYGLMMIGFFALPGSLIAIAAGGSRELFGSLAICAGLLLICAFLVLLLSRRAVKASPSAASDLWYIKIIYRVSNGVRYMASAIVEPMSILRCAALSFTAQLSAIVAVAVTGTAIHLHEPLFIYAAIVPVVWVTTMLPISILGIGVREISFAFLFAALGLPQAQGTALGVLTSFVGVLGAVFGGVSLLFPAKDA